MSQRSRQRAQHVYNNEMLFERSSSIILEIPPPEMVEEISRCFEASKGLNDHDDLRDNNQHLASDPTEESDSEDSLFITQHRVPSAVRSLRRCHSGLTSGPTSTSEHGESDDDMSAWSGIRSTSPKSAAARPSKQCKRRRKKEKLRTYNFPFLETEVNYKHQSKCKRATGGNLIFRHSASIGSFAIGGFLKCVKELGNSSDTSDHTSDNQASALPKVYIDDEESLSPLPEEDGISDEDDNFKVVEKRLFVTSLKARFPPTSNFESSTQKEDGNKTKHIKQTNERKRKKKHSSSNNPDVRRGDDESICNNCITPSENTEVSAKKNKDKNMTKNRHDYGNDVSQNSEGMDNRSSENAFTVLTDQDAEPLTNTKKQKTMRTMSVSVSEDHTGQSDDYGPVRKREKRKDGSFLVDDAVENEPKVHKRTRPSTATLDALKTRRHKSNDVVGDNVYNRNSAQVEKDQNPQLVVTEAIDAVREKKRTGKRNKYNSEECIK